MSTTNPPTTSYASAITGLLRDRPDLDSTPTERAAWIQRKVELLAAVEAAEAQR